MFYVLVPVLCMVFPYHSMFDVIVLVPVLCMVSPYHSIFDVLVLVPVLCMVSPYHSILDILDDHSMFVSPLVRSHSKEEGKVSSPVDTSCDGSGSYCGSTVSPSPSVSHC